MAVRIIERQSPKNEKERIVNGITPTMIDPRVGEGKESLDSPYRRATLFLNFPFSIFRCSSALCTRTSRDGNHILYDYKLRVAYFSRGQKGERNCLSSGATEKKCVLRRLSHPPG